MTDHPPPYTAAEVARIVGLTSIVVGGQRKLATRWGVSVAHINDIIHGRRSAGPAILKHLGLVKRLDTTITYVAGGTP